MPAVIDHPSAARAIDPVRFNVRGWVWLGDLQESIVAVEAVGDGRLLGQSMGFVSRPDVIRALGLTENVKPGFDFFADFSSAGLRAEFDLTIRARMRDGSQSAPLCSVRVQAKAPVAQGCLPATTGPKSAGEASGEVRAIVSGATPQGDVLPPDHLQVRQVGGVWGPLF